MTVGELAEKLGRSAALREERNGVVKKNGTVRESSIVRGIQAYAKRNPKAWCHKFAASRFGSQGIPDLLVVFTETSTRTTGRMANTTRAVFFEVKRPGQKPTPLQEKTMAAIRRATVDVFVVRSVEDAIDILRHLGFECEQLRPEGDR